MDIKRDFEKTFSMLVSNLTNAPDMADMAETNNWLAKVLEYNVPRGKFTRGLTIVSVFRALSKDLSEKNVGLSYILGWCLEILHSACLIGDDIMDGSETRRGNPSWYKVEGKSAINDLMLLENNVYRILKMYFKDQPYYIELLEIFHDSLLKTAFGQSLDTRTSNNRNVEQYSMDLYMKIVKYKTSYYTFYTPIRLGMVMAGITDIDQIEDVKSLGFNLGLMFQVQDDYLDCFGNYEITGKIGTDIQDRKCTWLYVTAMNMADSQQKTLLKEMYGKTGDNTEDIRMLYKKIGVVEAFHVFEDKMYGEISKEMEALQMKLCFPVDIFRPLLNQIYKRQK